MQLAAASGGLLHTLVEMHTAAGESATPFSHLDDTPDKLVNTFHQSAESISESRTNAVKSSESAVRSHTSIIESDTSKNESVFPIVEIHNSYLIRHL